MNRQDAKPAKNSDRPAQVQAGDTPDAGQHAIDRFLHEGQPLWDAIPFDVLCSRCGYNLRTLTSPRCPECGLEFDWRVVLDAGSWRSDFLFEHHWRTRPIRSWLKTTWRGLQPFRFFKGLSIHDDIHPGPLWFLLLSSVLGFVATLHGLALAGLAVVRLILLMTRPTPPPFPASSRLRFQEYVYGQITECLFEWPDGLGLPVWFLVMLLLAMGFLCLLRQTLKKQRVRAVQILRVCAYASTPCCVSCSVVLVAACSVAVLFADPSSLRWLVPEVFMILAVPGWCVLFGLFLTAGLRNYLHLPRPAALAFTAAGLAFLASFTFVAATMVIVIGGFW